MSKRKRHRRFLRVREYTLRGGKNAAKIIAVSALSTATSEGTKLTLKKIGSTRQRRRS